MVASQPAQRLAAVLACELLWGITGDRFNRWGFRLVFLEARDLDLACPGGGFLVVPVAAATSKDDLRGECDSEQGDGELHDADFRLAVMCLGE